MKALLILLFAMTAMLLAQAKVPTWANNSTKTVGQTYNTVCSGRGPSVDSARVEAITNCKNSAVDQLSLTTHFSSTTVETEKSVALYAESKSDAVFKNLRCNVKNEEIEDENSSYKVWVLCEFNLGKIEVEQRMVGSELASSKGLKNIAEVEIRDLNLVQPIHTNDNTFSVSISSVPICDQITVTGSQGVRSQPCSKNPLSILVSRTDKKILIKKLGFKPKEISVKELLEEGNYDALMVYLNPL